MSRIGSLDITSGISTGGISKGVKEIRAGLGSIGSGFQSTGKTIDAHAARSSAGLATIGNAFSLTHKKALVFFGAVGSVAALGGFTSWIAGATRELNTLAQTSERAGVTVNTLKGLQYAARATGGDVEAFTGVVAGLNRNLADAVTEETPFGQGLRNIGLNARDLVKSSPDVAIGKISDKLAAISDPGQRAYAITKLFGEEGLKLSRTLGIGSAEFQKYIAESSRLSGSINGMSTGKIEESNRAFAMLGESIDGIKTFIVVGLAPTVAALATKLSDAGMTGNAAFQSIGTFAGKYAVPAVGMAADVVHTLGLAFQGAQILATKSFQLILEGLALLPKAYDKVKNAITGGNEESTATAFLKGYASELDEATKKQLAEFDKSLSAAPPSDKIKKFYEDIAAASTKAAKSMKSAALAPNATGGGLALGKTADKINEFKRELQIENDKMGRGAAFGKLYDLKKGGATDKQLFGASQQARKNQLKEEVTSKNQETLNSAPESKLGQYNKIFQDFGKAVEVFKGSGGGASDRQNLAVAQLGMRKDLLGFAEQNIATPAKFAGAAELGSAESRTAILHAVQGGGKNSVEAQQLQYLKAQLDAQTQTARYLYQLANTRPPAVTVAVP